MKGVLRRPARAGEVLWRGRGEGCDLTENPSRHEINSIVAPPSVTTTTIKLMTEPSYLAICWVMLRSPLAVFYQLSSASSLPSSRALPSYARIATLWAFDRVAVAEQLDNGSLDPL